MSGCTAEPVRLEPIVLGDGASLAVPDDWAVLRTDPLTVVPRRWSGEPPAVMAVRRDGSRTTGTRLAEEMILAAESLMVGRRSRPRRRQRRSPQPSRRRSR